jgi:hypothetical protein
MLEQQACVAQLDLRSDRAQPCVAKARMSTLRSACIDKLNSPSGHGVGTAPMNGKRLLVTGQQ